MYNNKMLKFERSYELEKSTISMPTNKYYENYVDYEETQKTCRKCEWYSKNWSCPPFNENILEVWEKYNDIDLILLKLNYNNFIRESTFSKEDIDIILNITLHNEKRKILQKLNKKLIYEEGFEDSMIISTGYCNICSECTRIEDNPCRYPKNKLYGMESLGVLVAKTTEELFDTKILWVDKEAGKIPSHLTLLVGLLH